MQHFVSEHPGMPAPGHFFPFAGNGHFRIVTHALLRPPGKCRIVYCIEYGREKQGRTGNRPISLLWNESSPWVDMLPWAILRWNFCRIFAGKKIKGPQPPDFRSGASMVQCLPALWLSDVYFIISFRSPGHKQSSGNGFPCIALGLHPEPGALLLSGHSFQRFVDIAQ